jgi:hypothetical protein
MTIRGSLFGWLCALLLAGCFDVTKLSLGSDDGKGMVGPTGDAATMKPDADGDDKDDHDDKDSAGADGRKRASSQSDAEAEH